MKSITPQQLQEYIKKNSTKRYAIVDVRTPSEFRMKHVQGSLNIPLDTVLTHEETLHDYEEIFLYCQSGNRSSKACDILHTADIPYATSVEGGIQEMQKAGFHVVEQKGGVLPLQQQVLFGAGVLVTTGIVLSLLISSWFQLLSLGAGLGLMYAGLTGNCMMVKILSRMPWNQEFSL